MNFLAEITKIKAIILAGGFGTRLSHIVSDVPKPMVQVNNEPYLKINKVVLATGFIFKCIEEYFKDNYHSIEIEYSIEKEPLGTGVAIKQALSYCEEDDIYL